MRKLFRYKWDARYIIRGHHAPLYKHITIKARDETEAANKAVGLTPPDFRYEWVRQLPRRRFGLPKFRNFVTCTGIFLLGVAVLSPHWYWEGEPREVRMHVNYGTTP